MNRNGFVLVIVLFMVLLMSVAALSLNRRASMGVAMADNYVAAVQATLGLEAVAQYAVWRLTDDISWTTPVDGLAFSYAGIQGTVTVARATSAIPGLPATYYDGATIVCRMSESQASVRQTYRYFAETYGIGTGPPLKDATHIAMDTAGNLFIADTDNHRIRRLAPDGTMTTVAGTGDSGHDGNGGLAVHARLDHPRGVAVAANGDFYIADTGNHWIRKVSGATGIISLYAGSTMEDGSPDDDLFKDPWGLCLSASGRLYLVDRGLHQAFAVSTARQVSLIAGTGSAGYSGDWGFAMSARLNEPEDLCLNASGDLLIADSGNRRVRKVWLSWGIIFTVAGSGDYGYSGDGGLALNARFKSPAVVRTDTSGNLYIADRDADVVRVVSGHDGIVRTLAGTGEGGFNGDGLRAVEARLDTPRGLALARTRGAACLLISDSKNERIRQLHLRLEPLVY